MNAIELREDLVIDLRRKYKETLDKQIEANRNQNEKMVLIYKAELKGMRRSLSMLRIEVYGVNA